MIVLAALLVVPLKFFQVNINLSLVNSIWFIFHSIHIAHKYIFDRSPKRGIILMTLRRTPYWILLTVFKHLYHPINPLFRKCSHFFRLLLRGTMWPILDLRTLQWPLGRLFNSRKKLEAIARFWRMLNFPICDLIDFIYIFFIF